MAVAVADGILGLEGQWTVGSLLLNTPQGSLPRVVFDKIAGLHGRAEADDDRAQNTGRIGETVYPSPQRGKNVTVDGRVQAYTLQDLRNTCNALRGQFAATAEQTITVAPDPAYGTVSWRFAARCTGLDIDDDQSNFPATASPSPWQREFTLALRQSDPRYYLTGGPETLAGGFASGSTETATNQGTAPADPVIVGTVANGALVTMENLSVPADPSGHAYLITAAAPQAGTLTADFAARTVKVDNGAGSVLACGLDYLSSTWWDQLVPGLAPGANQIKVTGLSSWNVSWTSASW